MMMPSGIYPRKFRPISDRFWPKVLLSDGCWLWTGGTTKFGHGTTYNGTFDETLKPRARLMAHRVSYEIHHGKIPEGLCVLHKCDVPACVRPDHLFLGTKLDNMQDKRAKGREKLGKELPQTKLTDVDVRQIRASSETQRVLAKKYNISQPLVSAIKTGTRRYRVD